MAEISERGRARALIAAWKLRAETAEAKLAAVTQASAENAGRAMKAEFRATTADRRLAAVRALIGSRKCETNTRGRCDDRRTVDAQFMADRMCDPCIARAVLAAVDGSQPAEPSWTAREIYAALGDEYGVNDGDDIGDALMDHLRPLRAAMDGPADHIALFDGPPMRAAVDGPAEKPPHEFEAMSDWDRRCGYWSLREIGGSCLKLEADPIHGAGSGASSTQDVTPHCRHYSPAHDDEICCRCGVVTSPGDPTHCLGAGSPDHSGAGSTQDGDEQ